MGGWGGFLCFLGNSIRVMQLKNMYVSHYHIVQCYKLTKHTVQLSFK